MIRSCVLAAVAAALLVATSCSSGSGGKPTASSGVAAAMASVSGTGAATSYFEYGNMKRLRQLGIVSADAQGDQVVDAAWNHVVGYGASAVVASARLLPGVVGLNLFSSDRAVTIGTPPNTALRIDGVDTDAIKAKLTKLGAKPRDFGGTSGLSFGRDNSIADNRIAQTLFLPNQLDQIIATNGPFAASPNAATLERVRDDDPSLLDTGHYRDLADCLGNVIAAAVTAAKPQDRSTVRAVGVRDPGSLHGQRSEVVCFLPASGKHDAVLAAAKHISPRRPIRSRACRFRDTRRASWSMPPARSFALYSQRPAARRPPTWSTRSPATSPATGTAAAPRRTWTPRSADARGRHGLADCTPAPTPRCAGRELTIARPAGPQLATVDRRG